MTCLSMNEVTIALAKTMSDIVKCNRISFVKYSAYLCGLAKMIKTAGDFPCPAVLVIYPQITRSTELCFFFVLSAKHNSAFNSLGVSVAPLSSFLSLYQVISWQQLQHQLSVLEEQVYFNVFLWNSPQRMGRRGEGSPEVQSQLSAHMVGCLCSCWL